MIALLSTFILGEILLRILRLHEAELSPGERLIVTFGLGNGALVLQLFLFALGNLPLTRWTLTTPWVLVWASLMYSRWNRGERLSLSRMPWRRIVPRFPSLLSRSRSWAWSDLLLSLVLMLAVLDLLSTTLTAPFLYGDAVSFWAPKAKIFYHHRLAPFLAFRDLPEFAHPDYPLFLPLTEVWLFLWMGQVNEYVMKIVFPVYTILLIIGVWAFTSRLSGKRAGLIAAILFATTPIVVRHGAQGYADIMLTFYYWVATALLLVWFQTPRSPLLILGAIFLGLTGWVKNEGLPLILINGCALGVYLLGSRRSGSMGVPRVVFLFGGIAAGIVLPWLFVRYSFGFESDLRIPSLISMLSVERVWLIGKGFIRELFAPSSVLTRWNLVWYALVSVVVLHIRTLWRSLLRYPVLLIAGQVLLYSSVYMITPYDVEWHLDTSVDRLLLHLYPLGCCVVGSGLVAGVSGRTEAMSTSEENSSQAF